MTFTDEGKGNWEESFSTHVHNQRHQNSYPTQWTILLALIYETFDTRDLKITLGWLTDYSKTASCGIAEYMKLCIIKLTPDLKNVFSIHLP